LTERPAATLARVLGGVILMQGRLGHQVLGQLLLANSHDLAIAGASVVVAAASKSRDTVIRTVLQTAAPAAAIHLLVSRRADLVQRREARVSAQEQRWQDDRRTLQVRLRDLDAITQRYRVERVRLFRRIRELERQQAAAVTTPARRRRRGSAPGAP
jgi:hypothetical protein